MSQSEPKPLPEDIQALLGGATRPVPPPDFASRVLERVTATLSTLPPGGGQQGPPAESGGGAVFSAAVGPTALAAKMGTWGIPMTLAALVVGSAGGWISGARLGGSAPPPPTPAPASVVQREEPPLKDSELVTATPESPSATLPPPPGPKSIPSRPPKAQSAATTRDVALSEERALVELARTALARGELERSAAALAEHSERFDLGQLSEERDSLVIQLLVRQGKHKEARALVESFRQRYPESLLLPAVEAALQPSSQ